MCEPEVPRATLRGPLRRAGIGLFTGGRCASTVRPAPAGAGLQIRAGGVITPVRPGFAQTPGGRTSVPGAETVEHLLAALVGLGVHDAMIDVEGGEVPILDGSASPWVAAIEETGMVVHAHRAPGAMAAACVTDGHASARWTPGGPLRVSVTVEFAGGPSGAWAGLMDPATFAREIAPARTFARATDLPALRAAGRGAGASADCVVVWPPQAPLRFDDEPVRHKVLDLLGDLAWLGEPLTGSFEVRRGTHAIHQQLVRAMAALG